MEPAVPSRRERLRAQTLAEIKAHAAAQVAAGGPDALSLNGVAKAMGMSGPAIYRYFASRDDLLGALVHDAYGDLADALRAAAGRASRRAPARRMDAVGEAYRAWALAQPERYLLAFGRRPPGVVDGEAAIGRIQGAMEVVLEILADAAGADDDAPVPQRTLDRQLRAWAAHRSPDAARPTAVLHQGVLTWTRLHGIVSLELLGVLDGMGLDAGLLLRGETAAVVAAVSADAG